MADSAPPDGRLLVGRYRLRKLIGRGGMGTVWSAKDEILGREVAVKEVVPPPDLTPEQRQTIRQRTLREARAAARIAHPSAVTVYDVVEEDGRPWIVMQLLPPRTLADVIAETGPLPPAVAASIGVDLLDALQTAHGAGVLHRDVKPANVMLTETGRAVLTDFGIATVDDDPTLTSTGMLVGSPAFMAPERARGERPTPASDLWSLGATLYAAVEGESPYRRDGQLPTLHAVLTEPPPRAAHGGPLAPVIGALLNKDPAARPSAEYTRELLRQAAEAAVDEALPPEDAREAVTRIAAPPVATVAAPPEQPVQSQQAVQPQPTAPAEQEETVRAEAEAPAEQEETVRAEAPAPRAVAGAAPAAAVAAGVAGAAGLAVAAAGTAPPAPAAGAAPPAPAGGTAPPAPAGAAPMGPTRPVGPAGREGGSPTAPDQPAAPPRPQPASGGGMRVPSPTIPPSEGSGPPATPSAPDPAPRRRRMGLVALAAAALAAVVLLGALALDRIPGRNDQAGGRTPGSSPSASGGATASPSENAAPGPGTTSPTTPADDAGDDSSGSGPGEDDGGTSGSGSGGNSGSGNGSGSGSGRVPSGFEAYTDRTGFSLVVPRGWTVRREGTNVFFRRPSGRAYLQVAQTTTPEADVLKDWQDQARGAPGRFPDYELVRLRRVEYKGWDAADWEFTWRASGGRLHVIDRNIRVNDRRAYALYWSVPQEEWGDRQKDFRTIADSFRPAR